MDIYGTTGIIIAIIFFVVIYRRMKYSSTEKKLYYVTKDNPDAQTNYELSQKPKNLLTKDEKLELSWQFLYDITDVVLNKFSKEDKEQVHKIGREMLTIGGGYEHVIEYGLKKDKNQDKKLDIEQEKNHQQNKDRSV